MKFEKSLWVKLEDANAIFEDAKQHLTLRTHCSARETKSSN